MEMTSLSPTGMPQARARPAPQPANARIPATPAAWTFCLRSPAVPVVVACGGPGIWGILSTARKQAVQRPELARFALYSNRSGAYR